jgi:hypothetical protein
MNEIKSQNLKVTFNEMGEEIASHGTIFSFLQLRVSAEHFIVPLCGFAVERTLRVLMPNSFHLTFEKRVKSISRGPIDLIILPLREDSSEDWDNPYLFEFKMVWSKGFCETTSGLKSDLDKLRGYNRGYVIGVLFAFENEVCWSPYKHQCDIEDLSTRVKEVMPDLIYEGNSFPISSSEVRGQAKLMVWKA